MLFGWVKTILRRGKDQISFVVHAPKSNTELTCTYSGFLDLALNDTISAVCQWSGQIAVIVAPPFVEISVDRTSVEAAFIEAFKRKLSSSKASSLFNQLSKVCGATKDVASYVTRLSLEWSTKNELRHLEPFKGILTTKEAMQLLRWWYKRRELRRLYLLGLRKKEIKACGMRVDKIFEAARSNPYKLLGISLEKAAEICSMVGLKPSYETIECGMMVRWINDQAIERGTMGLPEETVVASLPRFVPLIEMLEKDFDVVMDMRHVYLRKDLRKEIIVASRIAKLLAKEEEESLVSEVKSLSIEDGSGEEDVEFVRPSLDPQQKKAVAVALKSPFCLVTGAAGTGKTTVINELCQQLTKRGKKWMLVSLTGKAVSHIKEVLDISKDIPRTIHRLIFSTRTYQQEADDKSVPVFNHLIVDEVSMVTVPLMYLVFKSFKHDFDLTLVGDDNQLPPIDRGPLLHSLVNSSVRRVNLTSNHRILNDKESCGILSNATSLIEATPGQFSFKNTKNFHFDSGEIEMVYGMIKMFYQNGTKPTDITVITPFNRDVDSINKFCQDVFNEGYQYVIDEKGNRWRVGDRVMLTVNNYDIDVMNGDEGIVVDFNALSIDVKFRDDNVVNFSLKSSPDEKEEMDFDPDVNFEATTASCHTDKLTLSYALTVHKSQASEWPHIIFFAREGGNFITRNMIYTAITRARKSCWVLVSNPGSFRYSLANVFCCPENNLAKRITK